MIKKSDYNYSNESFNLLEHMRPHIRISPFVPEEWGKLIQKPELEKGTIAEDPSFWMNGAEDINYYASGRNALTACLKHLKLESNDEVLIITTTQGPYISGCVTETIENICKWSREKSDRTKLALLIHEFGFPVAAEKIEPLKQAGIPILEDCAYALGSRINGAPVGIYGDYALFSLMKYFPLPFGGILVGKERIKQDDSLKLSKDAEILLKVSVANSSGHHKAWNSQRRNNWNYFCDGLADTDFNPYFHLDSHIVPGVFLTKVPEDFAGEDVKKRVNASGVESTQYYNQNGFYFPAHQFLTDYEKKYILYHFLNG